MNCNEAVAALVASLENGTPMSDEQRAHIQTCERCRELLDSAKQFQNELSGNGVVVPPVDVALSAAEEETRKRHFRRTMRVIIGLAIALGAFVMFVPSNHLPLRGRLMMLAATVVLTVVVSALLILMMKLTGDGKGKHRLFKRLGPGHMISGVCLGLAEGLKLNVTMVRLVFVALVFLGKGAGFWLYLLLNLAMPVHPDDRQYLLRFRLRRWWERRTMNADHHAG